MTRPGSASGPAILCAGGATPVLQNLYITQCRAGIQVTGSSPVLANIVVSDCYGTASGDAALGLSGSATVNVVGCTIIDSATTGSQVQVNGAAARLTMVNSIVSNSGASSRSGGR